MANDCDRSPLRLAPQFIIGSEVGIDMSEVKLRFFDEQFGVPRGYADEFYSEPLGMASIALHVPAVPAKVQEAHGEESEVRKVAYPVRVPA